MLVSWSVTTSKPLIKGLQKRMKISPNFTTSSSHLVACPTRKEAKDHVDGQVGHAVTAGLAGFHRPIQVKKP